MTRLRITGVDVSMTREVEELGGRYRSGGVERDLFALLAENGVDTVRLRLWVDPYDEDGAPYLGGTNDLPTTVALARRAADAGLQLLLDLHYSDFWTDPKKQTVPKAWRGLDGPALEDRVAEHTAEALRALADVGVVPTLVQVGNEITNGMLWPYGAVPRFLDQERRFADADPAERADAFDRLARLLGRGVAAVREGAPAAAVVLHLDFGGANDLYRGWFDEITARGVDFDVIGLSYYPYWHGTLDDLATNLADVAARYDKDVLVVETACAHRPDGPDGVTTIATGDVALASGFPVTVQGQQDFLVALTRVVAEVPGGRGLGHVYWEPAWLPVPGTSWASPAGMRYGDDVADPGNPWANQALFDFEGNALASWDAYRSTR